MDEKMNHYELSIVGIDGKPLANALVHVNIETMSGSQFIEKKDLYTDEQGVIKYEMPKACITKYKLDHGLYQESGTISISGSTPQPFKRNLDFRGFKVLNVSLTCPGLPDDAKIDFCMEKKKYHSELIKVANGKWETAIYVPCEKSTWMCGGDNIQIFSDFIDIKGDTTLESTLPEYCPVVIKLDNVPNPNIRATIFRNKLEVGSFVPGQTIYLWKGTDYSCLFSPKSNVTTMEGSFIHFEVADQLPVTIHEDYKTWAKKEKVQIEFVTPTDMKKSCGIYVLPRGYSNVREFLLNKPGIINEHNLPVGTYDFYMKDISCKGSFEVKANVENKVTIDISDWQKVTLEYDGTNIICLMDNPEYIIQMTFGQKETYLSPGTHYLGCDPNAPIEITVGNTPMKVVIPDAQANNWCFKVFDYNSNALSQATVLLDGKKLYYFELMHFLCYNIAPGRHEISVTHPGYKPYTTTLNIVPNENPRDMLLHYGVIMVPEIE